MNIIVDKVFTKFGMPMSITSDQGLIFKANFWSNFCYYFRVCLGYSIAIHPQTDGQTERQNQILEQYLKSYVSYQQNDWIWWLPLAEFAYNNAIYATTGKSPFQEIFGKLTCWKNSILDKKDKNNPVACQQAVNITSIRHKLKTRWKALIDAQAKHYNKKHKSKTYVTGKKVYLNSKNIESTRPAKKLDYKYYGPYEIEEPIGK